VSVRTEWGVDRVKNGIVSGKQRYKCKNCKLNFCEGDRCTHNKVAAKKTLCVLLYAMAKGSFRMLERLLDTDHTLVYRWIRNVGGALPEPVVSGDITEMEFAELWHFIGQKKETLDSQGGGSWHTANCGVGARQSYCYNLPTIVRQSEPLDDVYFLYGQVGGICQGIAAGKTMESPRCNGHLLRLHCSPAISGVDSWKRHCGAYRSNDRRYGIIIGSIYVWMRVMWETRWQRWLKPFVTHCMFVPAAQGVRKRAASGGVLAVTCGSLEESFSTEIDPLGKTLRKLSGDAPLELRSHYLRKIVRPLSIIGYALNVSDIIRQCNRRRQVR
jgi:hypothetical protein